MHRYFSVRGKLKYVAIPRNKQFSQSETRRKLNCEFSRTNIMSADNYPCIFSEPTVRTVFVIIRMFSRSDLETLAKLSNVNLILLVFKTLARLWKQFSSIQCAICKTKILKTGNINSAWGMGDVYQFTDVLAGVCLRHVMRFDQSCARKMLDLFLH